MDGPVANAKCQLAFFGLNEKNGTWLPLPKCKALSMYYANQLLSSCDGHEKCTKWKQNHVTIDGRGKFRLLKESKSLRETSNKKYFTKKTFGVRVYGANMGKWSSSSSG